jgi:hypothetical protein
MRAEPGPSTPPEGPGVKGPSFVYRGKQETMDLGKVTLS